MSKPRYYRLCIFRIYKHYPKEARLLFYSCSSFRSYIPRYLYLSQSIWIFHPKDFHTLLYRKPCLTKARLNYRILSNSRSYPFCKLLRSIRCPTIYYLRNQNKSCFPVLYLLLKEICFLSGNHIRENPLRL